MFSNILRLEPWTRMKPRIILWNVQLRTSNEENVTAIPLEYMLAK